MAAIARGDLQTYDRIVADDYVAFQATGSESTKAEILAAYRAGSLHYTGLEIYDVQGRVFGDTAVVSARTKGMRRDGDHDVPNRVRYIRVYAKRDGKWRAVTQMSAPAARGIRGAGSDAAPLVLAEQRERVLEGEIEEDRRVAPARPDADRQRTSAHDLKPALEVPGDARRPARRGTPTALPTRPGA